MPLTAGADSHDGSAGYTGAGVREEETADDCDAEDTTGVIGNGADETGAGVAGTGETGADAGEAGARLKGAGTPSGISS